MAPSETRTTTSSPVDHDARWRPNDRAGGPCQYKHRRRKGVCGKEGAHYCEPRADRVVDFFARILCHTKGLHARTAFVLEGWQEHEIVRPLFGEVVWADDLGAYVRRYTLAWVVIARKNGKSELAAGIVLYLLIGDDEESAEIYGAAKTTKQAGKVSEVVNRMRKLSPKLNGDTGHSGRLKENKNSRRIYDEKTGSYFEVIAKDADAELGHNPHGAYIDEVLSQPDDSIYEALRTALSARAQPLIFMITTETDQPQGFGAKEIDEAERVEEDPSRAPHIFAYVRKTPRSDEELDRVRRLFDGHPRLPVSTDIYDERNWYWANPALGSFKRIQSMRQQVIECRNDPTKEKSFRQLELNQRVSPVTRWLNMDVWNLKGNVQMVVRDQLKGEACIGGLDLASTTDLASWALWFPKHNKVLWRFWTPEAQLPRLDEITGGRASQWAKSGILTTTEGDWIDYEGAIHPAIKADKEHFRIVKAGYDPKEATATAQYMQSIGIDVEPVPQGYMLSEALKEVLRLIKAEMFCHGGNPLAAWNAECVEVRRNDEDHIKIVKPDRGASAARIDGIAAVANAVKLDLASGEEKPPAVLVSF